MDKQELKAQITEKATDGSFTAIASTASEDRHGEVVDPKGWNLKNFKKNPVLLWAHDHSIPAIGTATRVWVSDGKLMFKGMFHEATDFAKGIKQMVTDGILNSFSVGFLPLDMDGNTYTKQELLEISLVNVPANADAMMLAYKSLKKADVSEKAMKDLGIEVELVDKLISMEKDIKELQAKTAPVAPKRSIETELSLKKVVVRASNKLLENEKMNRSKRERIKDVKVIKRAVEILTQLDKEKLNG